MAKTMDFNPVALGMAKTLWIFNPVACFGRSECSRVKAPELKIIAFTNSIDPDEAFRYTLFALSLNFHYDTA